MHACVLACVCVCHAGSRGRYDCTILCEQLSQEASHDTVFPSRPDRSAADDISSALFHAAALVGLRLRPPPPIILSDAHAQRENGHR